MLCNKVSVSSGGWWGSRSSGAVLIALWLVLQAGMDWAEADAGRKGVPRPLGLGLVSKSATSVSLTWQEPTNSVGLAGYAVYCDDVLAGHASSNTFACTGLVEGTSYTFRVRAKDALGNLSDASNALLARPKGGVSTMQPVEIRTQFHALVLVYDPMLTVDERRVRASEHHGLRDVGALVREYVELFKRASGGQMIWSVTGTFELEEHPPAGPDCHAIIHDARFGIVDRVNSGALDALWIFGLPDSGFAETAMAGPDPYWVNGGAVHDDSLKRNIILYGFGRAAHQGVGFMCENTCHMTEIILNDHIGAGWPKSNATRGFTTLNLDNPARKLVDRPVNDFTYFTLAEAASWDPILVAPGQSQAGLSHFPPTGMHNYNWHVVGYDFGNADNFRVYDGAWSVVNGEYHVVANDSAKTLAFDGMTLRDSMGEYHPPVAFSDGDVEVNVRLEDGGSGHAGFLFRVNDARSGLNQARGYYVGLDAAGNRVIFARLDREFVSVAQAEHNVDPAVNYRLRIEARGPRIAVFLDGALDPLLDVTDTNYATGAFGFAAHSAGAWFDDLWIVAHASSQSDQWYGYPRMSGSVRDISTLEWNGDKDAAMDNFYAWWWEHLPKNGGGHYARDLATGRTVLILNTWWPYVFDFNRFTKSAPFDDIIFPPEDLTPPDPLPSIGGVALDAHRVGLFWEEPADNIGVTRYAVYRDGQLLAMTALRYLVDARLRPAATHRYVVRACDGSGNESVDSLEVRLTTLPSGAPVWLVDGGFELPPEAVGWSPGAFSASAAQLTWEPPGTGRNGSRCVRILARRNNDCRWVQTVRNLTPGAGYWLSGWVKGEGIVPESNTSIGANLCLEGTWTHSSEVLTGTFDWRQISFRFVAPPSGTVNIGCRLGYWSSTAQGTAWFDDIRVTPTTDFRLEGPRCRAGGNPMRFYRGRN